MQIFVKQFAERVKASGIGVSQIQRSKDLMRQFATLFKDIRSYLIVSTISALHQLPRVPDEWA